MSLNALKVALQGEFQLTPIALAVQGLIEELSTQQVYGSGGRGFAGGQPKKQGPAIVPTEEVSEDIVRDYWDLVELKRRLHDEPMATPVEVSVQPARNTQIELPGVEQALAVARRQQMEQEAEEEAVMATLLLMLDEF